MMYDFAHCKGVYFLHGYIIYRLTGTLNWLVKKWTFIIKQQIVTANISVTKRNKVAKSVNLSSKRILLLNFIVMNCVRPHYQRNPRWWWKYWKHGLTNLSINVIVSKFCGHWIGLICRKYF